MMVPANATSSVSIEWRELFFLLFLKFLVYFAYFIYFIWFYLFIYSSDWFLKLDLNSLHWTFYYDYIYTLFRHLREFVNWLVSEPMIIYYIDNFKLSMWPKGKLAPYPPERTDLVRIALFYFVLLKKIILMNQWFQGKSLKRVVPPKRRGKKPIQWNLQSIKSVCFFFKNCKM